MKIIADRPRHAFGDSSVAVSPIIDVPGVAISAAVESSAFEDQADPVQVWTVDEHHLFANGPQFLVQPFPSPSGWTRWLFQYPEQYAFRRRSFHRVLNGRLGCFWTGAIKTSASG